MGTKAAVAHQTLALWTNSIFQAFSTMMDLANKNLIWDEDWTFYHSLNHGQFHNKKIPLADA